MLDWGSLRAVMAITLASGWAWGLSMYSILDKVAQIPQSFNAWLAGGVLWGFALTILFVLGLLYKPRHPHQREVVVRCELESTHPLVGEMLLRFGIRVEETNGNSYGVYLRGKALWHSRQWGLLMLNCEEGTRLVLRASGGVFGSPRNDVNKFVTHLANELPTGAIFEPLD